MRSVAFGELADMSRAWGGEGSIFHLWGGEGTAECQLSYGHPMGISCPSTALQGVVQ